MKLAQPFRSGRPQRQISREGSERLAIHRDRFEDQPLLLEPVVEFVRLRQLFAHFSHPLRKGLDAIEHGGIVEVLHDLVSIADRLLTPELGIEKRLKVVLVPPDRGRRDDLVEIEIAEKFRLRRIVAPWAVLRLLKQDAVKGHA